MQFFDSWWERVRGNAVRYAPLAIGVLTVVLYRASDYFWE